MSFLQEVGWLVIPSKEVFSVGITNQPTSCKKLTCLFFVQEVGWLVIPSKEVFSVITHLCLVAEGARQVYTGLKGRYFFVTGVRGLLI